jgi:hypothetical protein
MIFINFHPYCRLDVAAAANGSRLFPGAVPV